MRILKIPNIIWIYKLLIFCCPIKKKKTHHYLCSFPLSSVQWQFHAVSTTASSLKKTAWEIGQATLKNKEPSAGQVSHERLTTMGWICLTNMLWLPIGSGTSSCPGVCAPAVWPDPPLPCFFFPGGVLRIGQDIQGIPHLSAQAAPICVWLISISEFLIVILKPGRGVPQREKPRIRTGSLS